MSDLLSYPAEGIQRFVIEATAGDAQLLGADVSEIEVRRVGDGPIEDEAFELEDGTLYFRGAAVRRAVVPPGISLVVEQANGDLRVTGLDSEVELRDVAGTLRLTQLAGPVRIGHVAADVRAAEVGDLVIDGACEGDLRLDVGETLSGELIAGDVRLRDIGSVRLGRARGDLWIERVRRALDVRRADGDVRLNDLDGPVAFQDILGDLRAAAIPGGFSVLRVSGDVILNGPFTADDGYELTADGDISITLPADADVRLTLKAGGRIRSDLTLSPTLDGSPTYTTVVGRGSTAVSLTSAGDLRVSHAGARSGAPRESQYDDIPDLRNLGERIRQQVQASLAAAGIGAPVGKASARQDRPRPQTVERAKPAPPREPSPEEQLEILNMVETGAISPEEAELLLKALES